MTQDSATAGEGSRAASADSNISANVNSLLCRGKQNVVMACTFVPWLEAIKHACSDRARSGLNAKDGT